MACCSFGHWRECVGMSTTSGTCKCTLSTGFCALICQFPKISNVSHLLESESILTQLFGGLICSRTIVFAAALTNYQKVSLEPAQLPICLTACDFTPVNPERCFPSVKPLEASLVTQSHEGRGDEGMHNWRPDKLLRQLEREIWNITKPHLSLSTSSSRMRVGPQPTGWSWERQQPTTNLSHRLSPRLDKKRPLPPIQ